MPRRRRVGPLPVHEGQSRDADRQENALPNGNKALAKHRSITPFELQLSAVTEPYRNRLWRVGELEIPNPRLPRTTVE